jgi:hypothetical protein
MMFIARPSEGLAEICTDKIYDVRVGSVEQVMGAARIPAAIATARLNYLPRRRAGL